MTAVVQNQRPFNSWWLVLLQGLITLMMGAFLLFAPGTTMFLLIQLLGAYWLVGGVFSLISIFAVKDGVHWGWKLANGVIGILGGLVVLGQPLISAYLLPTLLIYIVAIQGIVMGVIGLIQAFRGAGWGTGLWSVVIIIMGLFLFGSPLVAVLVLPLVIGGWAVVGGIMLIIYAFKVRKQ